MSGAPTELGGVLMDVYAQSNRLAYIASEPGRLETAYYFLYGDAPDKVVSKVLGDWLKEGAIVRLVPVKTAIAMQSAWLDSLARRDIAQWCYVAIDPGQPSAAYAILAEDRAAAARLEILKEWLAEGAMVRRVSMQEGTERMALWNDTPGGDLHSQACAEIEVKALWGGAA